jgi:hypothetical protein
MAKNIFEENISFPSNKSVCSAQLIATKFFNSVLMTNVINCSDACHDRGHNICDTLR